MLRHHEISGSKIFALYSKSTNSNEEEGVKRIPDPATPPVIEGPRFTDRCRSRASDVFEDILYY
jgi:hypothetical protein